MPTGDGRTGLHGQELGGDENLANALSAFLSQLHAGYDDPQSAEPGDQSPAVVRGHSGLEMTAVSRLGPDGAPGALLPRRLATSIGARGTPANRVLGTQYPKATEWAARPPAVAPRMAGKPPVETSAPGPFTLGSGPPANATANATANGDAPRKRRFRRAAKVLATPLAASATSSARTASGYSLGAPGAAPAIAAGPDAVTVASSQRRGGGVTAAAAITVALLLAAGLGVSLVWGHNKAAGFSAQAHQLALMQGDLGSSQSGLDTDEARIASQLDNIWSLDTMYSANRAQLKTTRAELTKVQTQLERAQAQLGQAQGQVGQAQSQLGTVQAHLSGSQAHAAQCQLGVSLGQQMFQLEGAFILLENGYLTAVQAKDAPQMQQDLAQMEVLDKQAQGVAAGFTAAVATCTHGE